MTSAPKRRGRPKGLPKTGGRKKGSANKVTLAKAKEIAESGLTPLQYMLRVLRSSKTKAHNKMEAARLAAPYCHPRLNSIEHVGEGGGPIQVEHTHAREKLAHILARRAVPSGTSGGDKPTQ